MLYKCYGVFSPNTMFPIYCPTTLFPIPMGSACEKLALMGSQRAGEHNTFSLSWYTPERASVFELV